MLCLSILHYYKNFRLLSPSNWRMNTMSNTVRKYSSILQASVSHIQRVIIKYTIFTSVIALKKISIISVKKGFCIY